MLDSIAVSLFTNRETAMLSTLEHRQLGSNICPGPKQSGAQLSGAQQCGAQLSWAQLSGAQLSGAHLSGAQLTGAQLSGGPTVRGPAVWSPTVQGPADLGPTVRGQIVRGPNCPGPSCPGPTVWGPIVWGPICQKPLEFVCVCVQIQKYSCCLCALLAGFKNELGLERNLFHSVRVFVPNNWDSNSRITEIQQLSLRPSGAV